MKKKSASQSASFNPRVLIGFALYAAGLVLAFAPMSSVAAEENPLTTTITEEATLIASDGFRGDQFGQSVSLSGDQALVGMGTLTDSAAYVFAFDRTTWTQQAILVSSDHEFADNFGLSVSLSGNRALIGAKGADLDTRIAAGAAYVFVFDGTSWQQEAKLTASDGEALDYFGTSVFLSGDRAIIGTDHDGKRGVAYTFVFDGTTWNQEARFDPF
jgi:hypothetical protein